MMSQELALCITAAILRLADSLQIRPEKTPDDYAKDAYRYLQAAKAVESSTNVKPIRSPPRL